MMEVLTHWLAEKSQIDFGNLAVVVGAMAVAVATLARVSTANNHQPKMKESKEHVA